MITQPNNPSDAQKHNKELDTEIVNFIDLCLQEGYLSRFGEPPKLQDAYLRAIAVSQKEAEKLLFPDEKRQDESVISPDAASAWFMFEELFANDDELLFSRALRYFSIKGFPSFCLMLGYAAMQNRKYERLFAYLQDDIQQKLPTLGLAVFLFSVCRPVDNSEVLQILQDDVLCGFLFGGQPRPISCWFEQSITISPSMLLFLQQGKGLYEPISSVAVILDSESQGTVANDEPERFDPLGKVLTGAVQDKSGAIIQLYGPYGIGKSYALSCIAKRFDCSFLAVDTVKLIAQEPPQLLKTMIELWLHCKLFNRILYLKRLQDEAESSKTVAQILEFFGKHSGIVIVGSISRILPAVCNSSSIYPIEFAMPTVERRIKLFHYFYNNLPLQADIEAVAQKYIMTPGQIEQSTKLSLLFAVEQGKKTIDTSAVIAAIHLQSRTQLHTLATSVPLVYGWNDLIIEPSQKRILQLAVHRVKYRHKVIDQWGFDEKLAYGRGISVLLYGPPGTGKTMAAQVIANELGLELYRVDLSQITSKYIGETEKNLSSLFSEARYSNAILFFDEADSLFAKRTEVKDSKDRNANVETSYLLQKMEEHDGFTILATNFVPNLDEAFRRRLSFVVNLQLPDKELRLQLWKQMFSAKAPCKDIDYGFLADTFEISGSSIKNIAVCAAFIAAEEGNSITMKHIVAAIKIENAKIGKVLINQDFGQYGIYFTQDITI